MIVASRYDSSDWLSRVNLLGSRVGQRVISIVAGRMLCLRDMMWLLSRRLFCQDDALLDWLGRLHLLASCILCVFVSCMMMVAPLVLMGGPKLLLIRLLLKLTLSADCRSL